MQNKRHNLFNEKDIYFFVYLSSNLSSCTSVHLQDNEASTEHCAGG